MLGQEAPNIRKWKLKDNRKKNFLCIHEHGPEDSGAHRNKIK